MAVTTVHHKSGVADDLSSAIDCHDFGAFECHDYWHNMTFGCLRALLQQCNYPKVAQNAYLSWYSNQVIPLLGPPPANSTSWKPLLTHNGSPMEPSINYTANKATVRFTVEPYGGFTGKGGQTQHHKSIQFQLQRLENSTPSLDLTWYKHFSHEFFVEPHEGAETGHRTPTCFIAFDLSLAIEPQIMPKIYLFPKSKAIEENNSTGQVVFNAIRSLKSGNHNFPALDMINEYFNSPKAPQDLNNVEMLGLDCAVAELQPRLKIYSNSFHNSFEKVVRIFTMDGRVFNSDGVAHLAELWQVLFADYLPEPVMGTDTWTKIELPHFEHPRSCIVYGFEIKPESTEVETKVYFPMWWYQGGNVSTVSAKLGQYFKSLGPGFESVAGEAYAERLSGSPVSGLIHTYLSFSYSKSRGVYITPYYSPNVNEN
jgi:DMATS type aromatic prenyltransferase